mmetsp:Transcript_45059/g.116503  ORF Transcript_45059/g.116503 Transcript_45059/m.116503 type:complete len:115 (-) Transcript_45059:592-936(-)
MHVDMNKRRYFFLVFIYTTQGQSQLSPASSPSIRHTSLGKGSSSRAKASREDGSHSQKGYVKAKRQPPKQCSVRGLNKGTKRLTEAKQLSLPSAASCTPPPLYELKKIENSPHA